MKKKKWLYIALTIFLLGISIRLVLTLIIEPLIAERLELVVNGKNQNFLIKIGGAHISIISSGIELDDILITSSSNDNERLSINGKIASVKIKGLKIVRAVLNKKISIKNITVAGSTIRCVIPENKESTPVVRIPNEIRISRLMFEKTDISISNSFNSLCYSIKEGDFKMYKIHLIKHDTLSTRKISKFDFKATHLLNTVSDSMYTYSLRNIDYSSELNLLSTDTLSIHPNYKDYDFTSRYEFQKDRIEAYLSNVVLHNFDAAAYTMSGKILCSYTEVENLELKVFRDKRKEFKHVDKPTFQDKIYSYSGLLRFDSIAVLNGNIIYSEHADKANGQGYLTFNKINARIYNITNDSIFITEKAFLELRCSALLMGTGKINILLKSRIFENQNTFSVNGTLSNMETSDLNPYLGNSAFVYATSGRIDNMDFSFVANNTESEGTMTLKYNGLKLAVKNKNTDDTTKIQERLISVFTNMLILDSNPLSGKEIRNGIINYERDTEKFLFSYCAKSIFSGVKSSMLKSSKKNKKD